MEQVVIKKKNSNKVRLIVLGLVVLMAVFFGIRAWLHGRQHETTDNAQLDATLTSVRSAVSGFVLEVRFVENQAVKKGDTLVIIDDKDYKAKVMEARSMLHSAESQTGISRSSAEAAQQSASASSMNLSALQANINVAKARLTRSQKELSRMEKMIKEGAATQQQLDAALAENEGASAMYEMAQRQFQSASTQASSTQSTAQAQQGQISVASSMVQQRLAELELAETQLKYTVILAPYDAVVSKKNVEVGQLIQYGQPLCSAVENNRLWVTANFKETQLDRIRIGQKVSVKLDAYKKLNLTGTVESIGGATGAKFSLLPPDNATGNFVKVTQRVPVRIKLDKMDNKDYYLAPGLSAFVDVEIN